MSEYKQHMNRHIVSAKEWLTKAEQSFAKESDLRGELDLFLAQAELEQAKKVTRANRLISKYPALEQVLAVTMALAIFTFGFGASYWLGNRLAPGAVPVVFDQSKNFSSKLPALSYPEASQREVFSGLNNLPQNSTGQMVTLQVNTIANSFSTQPKGVENESKALDLPGSTVQVSPELVEKPTAVLDPKPSLKPETKVSAQSVAVSNEEMKKLIKTAGKSLRDQ